MIKYDLKNLSVFSCSDCRSLPDHTHCSNWPRASQAPDLLCLPLLQAIKSSGSSKSWTHSTPLGDQWRKLSNICAWILLLGWLSNLVWSSQGRCLYLCAYSVYVCDGTYRHHVKCVEVRGSAECSPSPSTFLETGAIVAVYTSYLTYLPPSRDFPVSASHLTIQALGLQMCVAIYSFYIGSGDSNLHLYGKNFYFSSLVDSGYEDLLHCLPATHGDTNKASMWAKGQIW